MGRILKALNSITAPNPTQAQTWSSPPNPNWQPPQPPQARPDTRRSSLTPDLVSSFEAAAVTRKEDSVLAPPYKTDSDDSYESVSFRPKNPKPSKAATKRMRAVLENDNKYRIKMLRKDLLWLRKLAWDNQIHFEEVDIWEL